ncbi:hypothetical protein ACFQ0M_47880 [Kitasatospora aburaviensis]
MKEASATADIAAVQNCLNQDEPDDPALEHCTKAGIPYVPYRPLNAGHLARRDGPGDALHWLLGRGEHVAPIPGTGSIEHLRALITAVQPRGEAA